MGLLRSGWFMILLQKKQAQLGIEQSAIFNSKTL